MEKEEYKKFITSGTNGQPVFNRFLCVNDKFHILMCGFGKKCVSCGMPFIPQPHYGKNYPQAPHYPTETTCGFCVYDMMGDEHSMLLEDEAYGRDDGY